MTLSRKKSLTSPYFFRIHDTCGVNNLHGMPGIMAGLMSVLVVILASEETYGLGLYKVN